MPYGTYELTPEQCNKAKLEAKAQKYREYLEEEFEKEQNKINEQYLEQAIEDCKREVRDYYNP